DPAAEAQRGPIGERRGRVVRRALMRTCALAVVLLAMACGGGPRRAAPERAGAPTASSADTQRVLLISLDGFRWDYVDRAPAVRLRQLAARGVRADRLIPAFPSKTFP